MKVNLRNAVKMFYSKSSLETVYLEAVANALDANATDITIRIYWDGENKDTLLVEIRDNGIGFTDERFNKFSKLFDVEEASHRGLGRLSYLCYFGKIEIESVYEKGRKRHFVFDDDFNEKSDISDTDDEATWTLLRMSSYQLERIHKNDYIDSRYLKNRIYSEFMARLYSLKSANKHININITTEEGVLSKTETIDTDEFPHFKELTLNDPYYDLFYDFKLLYDIRETDYRTSIVTVIVIDDRCHRVDVINKENIISGYEMTFLLISSAFNGHSDASRQTDTFTKEEKDNFLRIFREGINKVLTDKVKAFSEKKERISKDLNEHYPHLLGYFSGEDIGYVSQSDIIQKAQEKFLRDQREILNCSHCSDEQFEKSITLASRTLAQYILFRQKVIERLKSLNKDNLEKELHNILLPMKTVFEENNRRKDLYRNNTWVLDERFMTYSTAISDKEMKDVISILTDGNEIEKDEDRPDIIIVFSDNPQERKADVVLIELKKKGLKMEVNSDVEIQLEKRVRALSKYYNNYIQRIWYYGIVEINEEYAMHLETDEYQELYSKGLMFVKRKDVVVSRTPKQIVPSTIIIMDIDAVVNDADARNATFLDVLKSQFQESNQQGMTKQ